MAPSHVRVAVRLHVKQLTGVNVGQPLSSEITHPGCRPLTIELLRDGFLALQRDAAPGVDDVTWRQYGEQVEERLPNPHERVQSGRYRAMPSKRVWIPKLDGRKRPIGIAVLEDKIVQQAVVGVLNQIYEEAFLGFSYGFRPNRHQHQALDAAWVGITQRKVNWVLDADIRGFFDAIDHESTGQVGLGDAPREDSSH